MIRLLEGVGRSSQVLRDVHCLVSWFPSHSRTSAKGTHNCPFPVRKQPVGGEKRRKNILKILWLVLLQTSEDVLHYIFFFFVICRMEPGEFKRCFYFISFAFVLFSENFMCNCKCLLVNIGFDRTGDTQIGTKKKKEKNLKTMKAPFVHRHLKYIITESKKRQKSINKHPFKRKCALKKKKAKKKGLT